MPADLQSIKVSDTKKLIKQLIKKYHPDLAAAADTGTGTEESANEIIRKLTNILNDLKIQTKPFNNNTEKTAAASGNNLVPLKNQDYLYYKLGIKYYKNIHPNFIYKRKSNATYELKPTKELMASLNNIILSIYLAEHYFTKVILEHPNSMWRNDSIAKVKLLLKLTKSYENINPNERKVVDSTGFVNEMGIKL